MSVAITLRNVRLGNGTGSIQCSLSIEQGDTALISGGTSEMRAMLLDIIARRLPPLVGAVCLFDRDIWLTGAAEVDAMLAQVDGSDPYWQTRTARQIVEAAPIGVAAEAVTPAARAGAVRFALHRLGLGDGHEPPNGMDLTEWYNIALVARAIVQRPHIVLVAENCAIGPVLTRLSDSLGPGATFIATAAEASMFGNVAGRHIVLGVEGLPTEPAHSARTKALGKRLIRGDAYSGATSRSEALIA